MLGERLRDNFIFMVCVEKKKISSKFVKCLEHSMKCILREVTKLFINKINTKHTSYYYLMRVTFKNTLSEAMNM